MSRLRSFLFSRESRPIQIFSPQLPALFHTHYSLKQAFHLQEEYYHCPRPDFRFWQIEVSLQAIERRVPERYCSPERSADTTAGAYCLRSTWRFLVTVFQQSQRISLTSTREGITTVGVVVLTTVDVDVVVVVVDVGRSDKSTVPLHGRPLLVKYRNSARRTTPHTGKSQRIYTLFFARYARENCLLSSLKMTRHQSNESN